MCSKAASDPLIRLGSGVIRVLVWLWGGGSPGGGGSVVSVYPGPSSSVKAQGFSPSHHVFIKVDGICAAKNNVGVK